jgi:hypothetical protein
MYGDVGSALFILLSWSQNERSDNVVEYVSNFELHSCRDGVKLSKYMLVAVREL